MATMERNESGNSTLHRSSSTLEALPSEKHDPLMDHLKNVDALSGSVPGGEDGGDLESQSPGRSLTRADTAAWVTKHPSRIPDDGISRARNTNGSHET
jgi:hypothetical protein